MYEQFIDYSAVIRLPDNIFTRKCYIALVDVCYQRWVLSESMGIDDVINVFRSADINHILQAYVGITHTAAKTQFKNLHMQGFLKFKGFSANDGKWVLLFRSPYDKDEPVDWIDIAGSFNRALECAGCSIEAIIPVYRSSSSIVGLSQP